MSSSRCATLEAIVIAKKWRVMKPTGAFRL